MPISYGLSYVACLALGIGLIIGAGLVGFYVAPALQGSHRVVVTLLAIAGGIAGIVLAVKSVSRLEESSESTDEPHLPGIDADVDKRSHP
jgi:hypothetical protein